MESLQQEISLGNIEQVKNIIHSGQSINASFQDGITPLNYALSKNQRKTAIFLLENGANVNKPDCFRYNERECCAIHYAAMRGFSDFILALINRKGMHIDKLDFNGCTALHYAAEAGHIDVCKKLLELGSYIDAQNKSGHTPLWKAINASNSYAIVSCLLQERAAVNLRDRVGATVLFEAVRKNKTAVIALLSRYGLNANIRDVEGNTALHIASCMGRTGSCDVILGLPKVDVNAINDYGNTPLHNSAIYNCTQTALMLLNYGACATKLNRCSQSALYLSMLHKHYDCTLLLFCAGAKLTQKQLQFYEQFEAKRCDFRAEFLEWALTLFQKPKSLYLLTISSVRHNIHLPIHKSVLTLGLPTKLCRDVSNVLVADSFIKEE